MPIVANGTTATELKDGEVGNFSLSFPSGTVTVHKLSQTNASGTTVYYYAGELTKTYNYSYDTISVNGTTLTSSYKLVAGTNTGIRYNAYYAKYTGGVLTLRSYRYMQTTASASNTTQLSIPSTTVKFDYTITRGSIDTVYARVGDTGSWVLVFGQVATVLYFVGNWKMNKLKADITSFFTAFASSLSASDTKPIWICPPNCYIKQTYDAIPSSLKSRVKVCAQNICQSVSSASGAYTGQISAAMAKDCGATMVMIGNSEVRQFLGLSVADSKKQVEAAVAQGLDILFCVGEDLDERNAGQSATVIYNQLAGLQIQGSGLSSIKLTVCYEPVWIMGTSAVCTAEQANQMCALILPWIQTNISNEVAQKTKVIFGGNVKENTVTSYVQQDKILGVMAGGASLNGTSFAGLINTATRS
nr:MAG TPA: TIM protein [Caudoviricetes sp.]